MRFTPLAAALLLYGCAGNDDDATPGAEIILRVEQRLASHPCVGDLRQWERTYRFSRSQGLSAYAVLGQKRRIDFHLRRAGTVRIAPGVRIIPSHGSGDWPDGPYIRAVDGQYDITTDTLRLPSCKR